MPGSLQKWKSPVTISAVSAIILCALILIVFHSSANTGFIRWDDDLNFVTNPWVKGLFVRSHWTWAWTSRLLGVYQPISWIFLQAQYSLAPKNPAALIHSVSLALHILNSLIVFALCLRLDRPTGPRSAIAALCGTLFFALHPLQCEMVAWASCQPQLLGSFLGGLSLLCFLESLDAFEGRGWYRLSLVLFAVSLLAKIHFVALPAVICLLRLKREGTELTVKSIFASAGRDRFFWLLSLCAFLLSLWARPTADAANALSWIEMGKLTPAYFGLFIIKTVLPTGLLPAYHASLATPVETLLGLWLLVGTLLCLAKPESRSMGLAFLALIVLLSPGLAAARTEGIIFADRYAYLPNAVLSLLIAHGVSRVRKTDAPSWHPSAVCAVFLSVALGLLSRSQLRVWSDSLNFWQYAIQNGESRSDKAHNNLGFALAERGRMAEAIEHYHIALEINPDSADVHGNLAAALAATGQIDEAIRHYKKALEIEPRSAEAHLDLGVALAGRGQIDDAILQFRKSLEIDPNSGLAHHNLGLALTRQTRFHEAISQFEQALELKQDPVEEHVSIGAILAAMGELDDAILHFKTALELNPNHVNARRNLQVASGLRLRGSK